MKNISIEDDTEKGSRTGADECHSIWDQPKVVRKHIGELCGMFSIVVLIMRFYVRENLMYHVRMKASPKLRYTITNKATKNVCWKIFEPSSVDIQSTSVVGCIPASTVSCDFTSTNIAYGCGYAKDLIETSKQWWVEFSGLTTSVTYARLRALCSIELWRALINKNKTWKPCHPTLFAQHVLSSETENIDVRDHFPLHNQ